jgi:uncharacterized protein YggE
MFYKTRWISVLLLSVVVGMALSACTTPVTVNTAPQPNTIAVTGNGIAYGQPDMAAVIIGAETRDVDPAKAVDDNTAKMNAIISALKELGIEEKDIQTSNFSVNAQQDYDQTGQPKGTFTYVVNNSLTVTLRDLTKVGQALGKAVGAGANSINGVSFSVNDPAALEAQARDKAMADAKARAEQLAKAAGVTLGAPVSISEFTSGPIPYEAKGFAAADAAGGGAPVPVSNGQIQVNLQVNVTYLIK